MKLLEVFRRELHENGCFRFIFGSSIQLSSMGGKARDREQLATLLLQYSRNKMVKD